MKVVRLAILAAVAALPLFAAAAQRTPAEADVPRHAAAPKTAAKAAAPRHAAAAPKTPDAQYGALQEVYGFCAGIVPTKAAYFKASSDAVLAGVKPSNVPAVLHDPEYLRGRGVLTESLQQLPQSDAVDACTAIIRAPKRSPLGGPAHRPR
jgi:hypothetical protein